MASGAYPPSMPRPERLSTVGNQVALAAEDSVAKVVAKTTATTTTTATPTTAFTNYFSRRLVKRSMCHDRYDTFMSI